MPTSLATENLLGYVDITTMRQENTAAGLVSGVFYQSIDCDIPWEDGNETETCHVIVENIDSAVHITNCYVEILIEKGV